MSLYQPSKWCVMNADAAWKQIIRYSIMILKVYFLEKIDNNKGLSSLQFKMLKFYKKYTGFNI